jgi:hypothetical protein
MRLIGTSRKRKSAVECSNKVYWNIEKEKIGC